MSGGGWGPAERNDGARAAGVIRSRRARLLAAAVLMSCGALVGGCGGGSATPPVASVSSTATSLSSAATPSATTTGSGAATGADASRPGAPAPGDLQSQDLAYAECMRANGVPNFPDPKPGGGFEVQSGPGGIDPSSPQYQLADAKCQKYMPNGGAGPTFNPQEGAQLLDIAKCMRQHGVPDFPDPKRAPTGNDGLPPLGKPGTYGRITNFQGWLLEFPAAINMQSPTYVHASAACRAQFLNTPQS